MALDIDDFGAAAAIAGTDAFGVAQGSAVMKKALLSALLTYISANIGTTFTRTILDDATAGDVQTTLGISTFVKTLLDDTTAAAFLTTLDADLATIAALTATTDSFIQSKSSAWAARTLAQVLTDLLSTFAGGSFGQLAFPATQNASANANTLDDYEEGTFTPAATIGGSAVGITFSSAAGRYTKIGRAVLVDINLVFSSRGGLTGALNITGLPFALGAETSMACNFASMGALTGLIPTVQGNSGSTLLLGRVLTQASGAAGSMTEAHMTDTSVFRIAGCYSV